MSEARRILDRTLEKRREDIRWLSSLPLRELRRRQSITDQQIGMCYADKNRRPHVLASLQVRDEDLACAVSLREFGEWMYVDGGA